MTNYEKLIQKLRELFMLDQADLDFGIYRIMNARRDEIDRFLQNDLLPQVRQTLAECQTAEQGQIEHELEQAVEQARGLGVDPETLPKVQQLRQRLQEYDRAALEEEVFSYLHTFFSRYYKDGDFISLRRYKEGTYAIPYEGEEVKLYWANHDQYYIKSSERFRDFTFKLPDGRRVHFKLVEAGTEQNNNKAAADKDRRFLLCAEEPLVEQDGELVIRFEYRPDDEKRAQKAINTSAVEAILARRDLPGWIDPLCQRQPTAANPNRTLLEKHLTDYTARNSFDYFIHKDLGKFLRRELDFFIKNEVMQLDDIENESAPRVEQYLGKIRVLRRIAEKLITFLAQIEDFQKKLWLKKKFVVETNYCITLDRVPEDLYPEIAANDAQREEWVRLFAIDEIEGDLLTPGYSEPLTVEFLKAHRGLSIDTAFFSVEFLEQLLQKVENLTTWIDGIIIKSENFQALQFLVPAFRSRIKATYIDPPYNTGDDGFPYKDSYQHSSWLCMLADRISLGKILEQPEGTLTISIDDAELDRLCHIVRNIYGEEELAKLVWDRNRKNDAKYFSVGHEYMLVVARDSEYLKAAGVRFREPKEGIVEARELFDNLKEQYGDDWRTIREKWLKWFDDIPVSDPKRRLIRYSKVGPRGPFRDDGNINWPGGGGPRYEVLHPTTKKPCRKPVSGWRYPTPERFWEEYEKGKITFGSDETTVPSTVSYLFESEGQVMPSVFYSYAQTAAQEFDGMFGKRVFDNPKNWRDLQRLLRYLVPDSDSWIIDYFAGTGSTAHAVTALNREDKGNRKYIMVEMGHYFESVLLPRIRKAIYSIAWRNGKPADRNSISHSFKYLRLESYEDALNNLELNWTDDQRRLLEDASLQEEYFLSYLLDIESRGSQSLLNVEAFRDPMRYRLRVQQGDETRDVCVDLIETFNWLLGLRVRHINLPQRLDASFRRSEDRATEGRLEIDGRLRTTDDGHYWFRTIEGLSPDGEKVLVVWRNLPGDPEEYNLVLDEWFRKQAYSTRDLEFDVIYVNGDNNLENLRREDETWKVRLIEEEFHRLMFDVKDV